MSPETLEREAPSEPWSLKDLPPFPWITTKVLQLFSVPTEEVEIKRLIELIRADTTLSTELLRRANSALYGLRCQVSTLDRAVMLIGLAQVKALVMTVGVASYLKAPLKLAILRRCWRHTLACALISEELAPACKLRSDQAYTAGLLHDVGRLALLVKYPQSYADLLSVVIDNNLSLLTSERDLFDIDHCEAGAWLAREWEFPEDLVGVIASHHAPASSTTVDLVRLVYLSCRLADCLGFEVAEPAEAEEPGQILSELPMSAQHQMASVITGLKDRVTQRVNALE